MRPLSRREKRLVVALCGVAALGVVSFRMAPEGGPNPEEVAAYYIAAFGSATQLTIHTPEGGMKPVTVTREKTPGLFSRLEAMARFGKVTLPTAGQPPKYLLDLVGRDGSVTKDIAVGFLLDSPKQPARGQLAFLPREMRTEGPFPVMAIAIEDYLDPAGAEARQQKLHQEMRQWVQQYGRQGGGSQGRRGAPSRSPATASRSAPPGAAPGR